MTGSISRMGPRAAAVFAWPQHRAATVITFLSPGLRFFHQGQFEGARVHVPTHLCRGPVEPIKQECAALYGTLLRVLKETAAFRDGIWSHAARGRRRGDSLDWVRLVREGLMGGNSYEALKRPLKTTVSERVEVRVGAERRRRWNVEEKLQVVRETLEPGAVTKAVAERHGISTGLLYTWRKQMLATAMAGFVPVQVAPEAPAPMLAAPAETTG